MTYIPRFFLGTLTKNTSLPTLKALTILALLTAALPAGAQSGQIVGLGDKCADVFQAGTDPGTPVVLWQCSGNDNQQWQFVDTAGQLEIVGLGDACLVPGAVGASGHPELEIGPCGSEASKWNVDGNLGGSYQLVHAETGLCADVFGLQTANGTPLIAFECRGQQNQTWRLVEQRALPAYVVPYFEVENTFNPLTTLFAVRNPASYPVMVRYEYFADSNGAGAPSRVEIQSLAAGAVRTADVRVISGLFEDKGWIGITAIDGPTGVPLAVQDLYGDYFRVDPGQNFATGEKLLASDAAFCNSWHIRFLNGGDFNGGTSLRFFVPEFGDQGWTATGRVFNEQGAQVQVLAIAADAHSAEMSADDLPLIPSFGAIEWTFGGGMRGHLSAVMDALGRFSVGFEAQCRDAQ